MNYNPIYRKSIDDKNIVVPTRMTRGRFYLIKEYDYVDALSNHDYLFRYIAKFS